MDHPMIGNGALHVAGSDLDVAGPRGLAPLDEARGVVRDVLAAVRNVEHLLRSRKVGARALAKVVPGLQGLCDPLIASVDEILLHVERTASVPVDDALASLGKLVGQICEDLKGAQERASRAGSLDAKARLAFEGAIVRAGGELHSVQQLLDLLIQSTGRCDTELDLEELVHVASSSPASTFGVREAKVRVFARYASDGSGFQTSPRVFMPLLAIAIAVVSGDECACVYLDATCREGEPVVVTVGREGTGAPCDELRFDPPVITAASLICAEAAARLGGGRLTVEKGRAVLAWRRSASAPLCWSARVP